MNTTKEALESIQQMAERMQSINNMTQEQRDAVWQALKILEKVEEDIFL
jgi:hypothetical protein